MLKETCAATLEWFAGFVVEPVSYAELRSWCRSACREMSAAEPGETAPEDDATTADARRIADLAQRLFSEHADSDSHRAHPNGDIRDLEAGRVWLESFGPESKSLGSPCPERFGFLLDALADAGEIPEQLCEQLLRHVEVRRSGCLKKWERRKRPLEMDCERLAVAIFLFHNALRNRDLRFLNSGLKMFDWFGAPWLSRWRHQSRPLQHRVLRTALEAVAAIELLVHA